MWTCCPHRSQAEKSLPIAHLPHPREELGVEEGNDAGERHLDRRAVRDRGAHRAFAAPEIEGQEPAITLPALRLLPIEVLKRHLVGEPHSRRILRELVLLRPLPPIGRASLWERACQYV